MATDSVLEAPAKGEAPTPDHRRRLDGWGVATIGVVAVVAAAGLALRAWILQSYIGLTNSDESTTGLMALGILRGDLPLFVAGNSYGGTLEAYLAAPLFALASASDRGLKGLNIALWVGALVLLYFLARLVLSKLASLAVTLVVWVASAAMIYLSTLAYSGYATGICAFVAGLLVAGRQADAERPSPWAAALAGVLGGVAIWLHPMFVALIVPAYLVVTWRHRQVLARWFVPAVAGGLAALAPTIVYNALNGWGSFGDPYPEFANVSYLDRLGRFAVQLGPRAVGLRDLDGWYGNRFLSGAWTFGAVGLALYVVVAAAAITGLVILFRRSWAGKVLAVSAFVSPFILAIFGALSFFGDGRYGINFIAFVVLGVVTTVDAALRHAPSARKVALLALPVVWLLVFAVPSVRSLVPAAPPVNSDIDALVARLDESQIAHVRTDYWVAYRLAFRTEERIQAGLLTESERLPARFSEMQRNVDLADPRDVAYVFYDTREGQPDVKGLPLDQYVVDDVGPFRVYVPRPNG